MQNGGWGIVLVIIALAILTGFMVEAYLENLEHEAISQATIKNIGEQLMDANTTVTVSADKIQNLNMQLATTTAESGMIDSELKKAQAARAVAETTVANLQATIDAGNSSIPPSGGYPTNVGTVISPVQGTPKPLVSEPPMRTMGFNITWLPALALGFFVIVVAAAYRMLKIEDQQQSQAR